MSGDHRLHNVAVGTTMTLEPHDRDDRGIVLAPGQRCRVKIVGPDMAVSFLADRHMLASIERFLDDQK